jgi:hypothetical protein
MRIAILGLSTLLLASCASTDLLELPAPGFPMDKPSTVRPAPHGSDGHTQRGLEAVIGRTANQLTALFGKPRIDVIETVGRKMQFASRACILDTYLYSDGRGGAEIVTHVDARRSDGAEVDRVQCINALMGR